jgi:hypothetical protein
MQTEQLKNLIANGAYRPQPALVAEAMLERRGVRTLLTEEPSAQPDAGLPSAPRGTSPISPSGHTPPAPEAGYQAA